MTPIITGLIVCAIVFVPLAIMVGLATRVKKPKCIYPHCSASRAHCLHVCPNWRDDHASDDNLGI
jgi:hypothetical protein